MFVVLLSTINSDYVIPFRVMAHSLIARKAPATGVRWHLVATDLLRSQRLEIEEDLSDPGIEIVWHEGGVTAPTALPTRGRAVSTIYERIQAPEILGDESEKVLYLDGDLLVQDRIEDLWATDLDGMILGAVQDLAVPLVSSPMGLKLYESMGLSRDSPYFNAGVYLMDLDAWRKLEIGRQAWEYLDRHGRSVNLLDQDALNAVVRGRWKPLGYRWNLTGGLVGRQLPLPRGVDPSRLEKAVSNPGIIHFSGTLKPWLYPRLGSIWAAEYQKALLDVYPDIRLDKSLRSLSLSFYDRRLRRKLYMVERFVWRSLRGF